MCWLQFLIVHLLLLGLTSYHSCCSVAVVFAFIDDYRHFVWPTLDGTPTKLAGHRGEKAFLPEHTIASYYQAGLEGVDFIEPDLALTKDGVPVCHHNEYLSGTTNIADLPQFADRRRKYTWVYDGSGPVSVYDWFIVDFTLDELKQVRVRQENFTWRPQVYNDLFAIPTFAEYLDAVRHVSSVLNRSFGIMPEIKSPKLFNRFMPYPRYFEDTVLAMLQRWGYGVTPDLPPINDAVARYLNTLTTQPAPHAAVALGPAVIQSFDADTVQYVSRYLDPTYAATLRLNEADPTFFTPSGLDLLATYTDVVGTWKDMLVAGPEAFYRSRNYTWDQRKVDQMGGFIPPDQFVNEAHRRGIKVALYTFYSSYQDPNYLCPPAHANGPPPKRAMSVELGDFCPKDKLQELFYFFDMGVDYMFVEDIVEAQEARIFYTNKLTSQQQFVVAAADGLR
ncbi:hypothetical protein EV182_000224 [Spiromyces aspiralis]|uniref:Uncharacterized protein n=1 Tax=Spiromyces aspiralis TaxID=68401 RepID=A0ACC1HKT6_9FUNG|nr:hypothetical protein EV182_000224 [Spiromyces aspiralis]